MVNNFHTIKSGIVRDALYCIGQNPLPDSYIGGGLSLQFTLPDQLHRITCDIDLSTTRLTTVGDYRAYVTGAFDSLVQRGYSLEMERSRNTLDAHLERDNDHLMVQLPRRNEKNLQARKVILEREVEQARNIIYSGQNLKVMAYEDLIVHKLMRSTTFMDAYGLKLPQKKSLGEMKEDLDDLKERFDRTHFSLTPEEAARDLASIRLYADVFDIRAVLTCFPDEFDKSYLQEAMDSFHTDDEKIRKWQRFFDRIS